jgi:hypothetical protein
MAVQQQVVAVQQVVLVLAEQFSFIGEERKMKYWALIENDVVVNTIVADSAEIVAEVTSLEFVEYTIDDPIGIGYIRKGKLITPPPVKAVVDNPEA